MDRCKFQEFAKYLLDGYEEVTVLLQKVAIPPEVDFVALTTSDRAIYPDETSLCPTLHSVPAFAEGGQ
jgi:hypothetical protein